MRLSARLLAASALALSFAVPAMAQDAATIQRAERIRDGAMQQNIALDYVTRLTTTFGARPAGS
ncbi:MAG: peptidase M28 family protein, partial [Caulobacteraceae bacterium]